MPVRVYPSKGRSAISEYEAKNICSGLNDSNHKWSVTYTWGSGGTLFTVVGGTDEQLSAAIRCPGGQITKIVK